MVVPKSVSCYQPTPTTRRNLLCRMSLNNKDEVKVQRVFVGGLYTGIAEEDLTKRLSKFGNVKNVYIHERQNDGGVITKTFAVLEMETTEKNLSKCFTAYSNSMWKGHTMRLQKYKEDPFERERKRKEPRKRATGRFPPDNQHSVLNTSKPMITQHNEYHIRNNPEIKTELSKNTPGINAARKTATNTNQMQVDQLYPKVTSQDSPVYKPNSSFAEVQHGKHKKRLSESDQQAACQGVPKFGGIYLQSSANSVTKNTTEDEEFVIVTSRFQKSKPVDVASDNESVATDEIIAVSKLKKKQFVATNDDPSAKKPTTDIKLQKYKHSLEMEDSNINTISTSPSAKQKKQINVNRHTAPGTSKGVLGRLEGFSSVWQDSSDDKDCKEWERNMLPGNHFERQQFQHSTEDAIAKKRDYSGSQQLQQAKIEKDGNRLRHTIKTEPLQSQKFSPVNTDGKFRNVSEHDSKEKHVQDNRKRLESLKKIQYALADKKKAIEVALSFKGEMPPTSNKKIKFDSDGEDAFEAQTENNMHVQTDVKYITNGPNIKQKQGQTKKKEKQLFLFDDDDGEENEAINDNAANMFHVRPQFEGASGEKLFKLQSRFGDDKRFIVDQRFLEDDSSEDENKTENMTKRYTDTEELEEEKSRNLQILQNVIGNDVVFKNKNEASFKGNSTMLRYDPSKADHSQFEIKGTNQAQGTAKRKKVKKTLNLEPEPLPEVSKETFYELNDNLKSIFEKKSSEGESFSILKAMGRDQSEADANYEKQTVYDEKKISTRERNAKLLGLSTFKYDSSDDDNDQAKEIPTRLQDGIQPVSTIEKTHFTFFFKKDDSRLIDSISFFRRTETLDVLQEKWKGVRRALYEDLLTKSKRSIRKRAPKKVKKGGMPKRRFKPMIRKHYK